MIYDDIYSLRYHDKKTADNALFPGGLDKGLDKAEG